MRISFALLMTIIIERIMPPFINLEIGTIEISKRVTSIA
jgi:hypothetical protein